MFSRRVGGCLSPQADEGGIVLKLSFHKRGAFTALFCFQGLAAVAFVAIVPLLSCKKLSSTPK
jgi:hypothetical protein